MKKFIVYLWFCLFVAACSTTGWVCTKMTPDKFAKAEILLEKIQQNYPALVGIADMASKGSISSNQNTAAWVSVAGPILIALADTSLKALGNMIATGCADDTALNLAQINVDKIDKALAQPIAVSSMKTLGIRRF